MGTGILSHSSLNGKYGPHDLPHVIYYSKAWGRNGVFALECGVEILKTNFILLLTSPGCDSSQLQLSLHASRDIGNKTLRSPWASLPGVWRTGDLIQSQSPS